MNMLFNHYLCIDPGPTQSGWVRIRTGDMRILDGGNALNEAVIETIKEQSDFRTCLVIEQLEFYGQLAGSDVFDTAYWAGRFVERFRVQTCNQKYVRIKKPDVNYHLCGRRNHVKDAHIKAAIQSRLCKKGTKKNPDRHGIWQCSDHMWDALALGVVYHELQEAFDKETEYAF
jgi:hypothetical protein